MSKRVDQHSGCRWQDNIKAPHYYGFVREIHIGGLLTGGFPPQWANYVEIGFVS